MNTIQASIYGAEALIYMLLGHTPKMDPFSTINERLNISPTARPTSSEPVRLGVLVVGNRGHRSTPGDGGIALTSVVDHLATHAAPYNPTPFCLRPVDEDLSLSERAKYCLRKELEHGGVNYYAYYGLRLNITEDDVEVKKKKIITNEDGSVTEELFVPTNADLYPTPVELPVVGAVTTTNVRVAAFCSIRVSLLEKEIEEYVNALKILHNGDERYAIMSEFALCIGADRQLTVNSSIGSINFLESIGTQVYSFSADHKVLYYNSQELTMDFEVGNQLPMLAVASIPTLETIP